MPILPTYRLSGPGGTVDLSRVNGPEELQFPTEIIPTEIRRCISEDDDPGAVYLLHAPYQLAGQTKTTAHRLVTSSQHALLTAWHRDKDVLAYQGPSWSASAVIIGYEAAPWNVRHRWASQIRVDELTIMFVEA